MFEDAGFSSRSPLSKVSKSLGASSGDSAGTSGVRTFLRRSKSKTLMSNYWHHKGCRISRKPLRPDELNWLVVALLPPPAEGRRGPIVIRLRYDKVCPTTGGGAFGSLHISQIEQRPLTAKGESEMRTNVPIRPRRRSA